MTENYEERFNELYDRYLNREIGRDEMLAGHEALVREIVDASADDMDALRQLRQDRIRCSREDEIVMEAMRALAERDGLELCHCCFSGLGEYRIEVEHDDVTHVFCSTRCANSAGYHETMGGRWVHEDDDEVVHSADGEWFVDADDARDNGYMLCPECGEWFDADGYDAIRAMDDEVFCSETCAMNAGYYRCERCEEWHHDDYMNTVVVDGGYTARWCDGCCEYNTRTCDHCNCLVDEDAAVWDEDDDEYYCPSCARRYMTRGLHEYGYTPELVFRGNAKNSPYLGVELETDGGSDRCSYVDALGRIGGFNEHFYMTRDSSLDNGVEITSHPMTLAYHANDLGAMYEEIRTTALSHGFQSHNGGRCGLHVHVNRDFFGKGIDSQDVGGYKMMRLLQRFENNFTKFSRRRDNGWCNYNTNYSYGPDVQGEPDDIDRVLKKAKDMKRERRHEQALNFQHDETYEFRIFRGTLNLSTFYASLGMVNGIAHVAKMHSAHYVETVEWSQLMADVVKACDEPKSRECLREYLEAKELL